MVVRSQSDAVRAVVGITLLSILVSVLIAWGIATVLDKKFELVFAVAVPAIGVPFFVIPLVRANLRLYQARVELEWLVRTDSLTGLANRRYFLEQATDLFSSPEAKGDDVAVMMVDIDHFKQINDCCGHASGDRVLKLVADTIVSVAEQDHPGGNILVGRLGGEEFSVLARGLSTSGAIALAEKFCEAVRRLKSLKDGHVIAPTLSVGIAMRRPGEVFAQALKAADVAVYEAKDLGRDRWCIAHREINMVPSQTADASPYGMGGSLTPRRNVRLTVEVSAAALPSAASIPNALPA